MTLATLPPPPDDQPPHDPDYDTLTNTPRNTDAERTVLGAMLNDPTTIPAITNLITPTDYYEPRHETIANAIERLHFRTDPVDPITVADWLQRTGDLHRIGGHAYLHELAQAALYTVHPEYHAGLIAETAYRRRITQAAHHIAHLATQPGDNLPTLAAAAQQALQAAHTTIPGVEPQTPGLDIDAFLSEDPDDEPHWLIPGFLEHGDRCILTAAEGAGKSTLLRQWATQAAAGIHPFTLDPLPAPLRALIIDLENPTRLLRRELRPLRIQAGPQLNPHNLTIISKPDGLDLTQPTDRAWLDNALATHTPDLLITGPIYKLAGGNPNDEVDAKPAAMTLDAMRTKHDFALLLEAHTRKSETSNPKHRAKEPFGWSGWMRWPEIGIHLSNEGEITHWRGMRGTRTIPDQFTRGGQWPWAAENSQEWARFTRMKNACEAAGRILTQRELSTAAGTSLGTVNATIRQFQQQWEALKWNLREDPNDD